jgi:hypothetical protein
MTDADGQFTAQLVDPYLYTIATGLEAIAFDPLLMTGAEFASRSPVTIEAARLVSSTEDPCRILIDGRPHVYLSTNNIAGKDLNVPLTYPLLNQIYSVTGEAVPPENFAPGISGISVPESYFTSGTTLTGVWKFLGQEIQITPDLQVCSDRGVPGQCEVIEPALLRTPFEQTRKTVITMTELMMEAARQGRWRNSNGRTRLQFLTRGARALAAMERAFPESKGQIFSCEVVPMSCSIKRVPKKELLAYFSQIFTGPFPRGLETVAHRSKREITAFQRLLKKLPNTIVTCE